MSTEVLGGITLALRLTGIVILSFVLHSQAKILRKSSKLQGLKWLLFYMVLFFLLAGLLPAFNNYIRLVEGEQSELFNNITFVMGGVSYLVVSNTMLLIYRYKVKE